MMRKEVCVRVNSVFKLWNQALRLFSTEDFMIIGLVAACVIMMPFFVLGLRKRSYVRVISLIVLAAYAAGELYFTFFNRSSLQSVNMLEPMRDIRAAFRVDDGVVGFVRRLSDGDLRGALSAVHIGDPRKAREVFLNILLFLPLGYLLPFVSKKLRNPFFITLIGFLCSLATECAQFYTRLGTFQVDDLVCNTLGTLIGGLIGVLLCALWRVE